MLVTEQQGSAPFDLLIFESLPGCFLLLSPTLHLLAASDAYLELTGKDRVAAIGQYLFDVFPESEQWAPGQDGGVAESLKKVLGSAIADEMPVVRFDTQTNDGRLEERYWKTVNQPVNNPDGRLLYIIHHTREVTVEVLKERQASEALATETSASRKASLLAEQMERLFHDIPAQIAIVRGPDLVYDYINPQYQRELFPGREVLGLPLLAALPEVEGQPIWHILQDVYVTGKPYIQNEMLIPLAPDKNEPVADHYFNLVYQPLFNEAREVYAILSFKYEITAHVARRKVLEEKSHQLSELNGKLGHSLTEQQALHEEVQAANEELVAINEELMATQASLTELNHELEDRIMERTSQLEESFGEQQALNEEIRAANEELTASNEELAGTQRQLQETLEGLTESEQRFRNLVRDASVGIILLTGQDLDVSIVNEVYGRLIGRTPEELEGRRLFEVIPEAEAVFRPVIERVRDTGSPLYLYDQPYLVYKDGDTFEGFLNLVYQPYRESDGRVTGVMVLCQDVSEQVTARQELERSEARFGFLLNAMPQQVWTATPDGALNYVNQVISVDFGHSPDSVVGHNWQEFVHPEDLPGALDKWMRAVQGGREYLTEFRLKFADGNYYWHLARALPLIEDGKVTLWLGTNTNIHQQKANENQKDEFLSIASHELKTPLTTIKAFFQLAKREAGEQKVLSQFVGKAERQLERLGRLIEDLLDVSKINAGKMVYNMEEFNFGQALTEIVESMQPTTPRHRIEQRAGCDIIYRGDRHRIEQVLINVLNNAIKYSPDADLIIVSCALEQQNLVVSIQDFGIGIAEEHLKGLFDRFYRVDNSSARFQGLGLGLFISAEIVRRHGGSFWIESYPGEGSTFYFLLPLSGRQEFADIATDQQTYYEGSFINMRYRPEEQYLDVSWAGYQNFDSVVKGCGIIIDLMQKNKCSKVLNDNTLVKGNWSEASDWGAKVWFPAMAKAGLKKFAWIYSPSTFSRISADISLPSAYDPVAFFNDREQAIDWLQQ